MKLFVKPPATVLKIKCVIFVWIVLCNLIVQGFHHELEHFGIAAWNIFLVNIMFFLMEEDPYKVRWIKCFCGIIVGLTGAWALCMIKVYLVGAGLPDVAATMIPLAIMLFLIIIGNSFVPYVFNNVGFGYFTVGLINPQLTCQHLGTYMLGGILGNLIINGIAVIIITNMVKYFTQKAKATTEK